MIGKFFETINGQDAIEIEIGPYQKCAIVIRFPEDNEKTYEVDDDNCDEFIQLLKIVVETYEKLERFDK